MTDIRHIERCRGNRRKNNNYNAYKKIQRAGLRKWMDNIKESQPCTDCGFSYPACVMEWDHLPGTKKRYTISRMITGQFGKKRIKKEMAKCELVCANCHRIRTHVTRKARNAGAPRN